MLFAFSPLKCHLSIMISGSSLRGSNVVSITETGPNGLLIAGFCVVKE